MRSVNLLPDDQRRRRPSEGGGKGAYAVLGVLGVLLAMVAAYVLTSNQVTERQNETAAVRQEADQLEAQAAQNANYTDFAQIATTRTQAVAGVATTRFDWERFMRELSLIMPTGSWLQTTDASVTGATAAEGGDTGATETATRATAAGPTATLVGCTPDQSDVARMMVRLRQAHRVLDVKLNESAREQGDTPPSVDSCGRLYQFDLTVEFSPSEPGEPPRGERRVPTSLGGGS